MSYLLRQSARGLSALEANLTARLSQQMLHTQGQRPSPGEARSWQRSLPILSSDLIEAGLGGVEMIVEYKLPMTSKRADVVLAGTHPRTGEPSYVIVELKQWTEAHLLPDSDVLVSIAGYGSAGVSHPLDQVRGYVDYLRDYVSVLADTPDAVAGVAYLHNATDYGVADLLTMPQSPAGRLFTGQRRGEFRDYLQSRFAPTSGADAADALLASRIAPSKQLLRLAADEVQRREMFVLIDEQRDAFHHVLRAVETSRRAGTKTAVVVSGGPGSGKSVIALSLLGHLAREGRTVVHATGSRSFTQTLRKVAGRRAPRVQKAFQYFNSFTASEPNDLECLILDEAHRIRDTSVNRWTRAEHRTGRSQIDELLAAARVPIFLLDQHQVVRPGEQGTAALIDAEARARGLEVVHIDLDMQFRCGGSLSYVLWVQQFLGIEPGQPSLEEVEDFDVRVADSPSDMETFLEARLAEGHSARLSAGYCWKWSDPLPDGSLVPDVQVGHWARPWNLKGDRAIGGAPPAALWATDPAGFGQVGCVYTAQGFEYDYAGVIIGPDLVWRDDRWVAVRSANHDPDFRNRTRVSDEQFDRLIRNVYKVLLTRGLRGVCLFSPDPETQTYLRSVTRGSRAG